MAKSLMERVPDRVLMKVVSRLLQEQDESQLPNEKHWSELISDKALFFELLNFYFPDEKQTFASLKDKLTEDSIEDMLRHGVPFRYGHLEGVREQFILSMLLQDHETQQKLLAEHPIECLTSYYVKEREEEA